MHAIHVSKASHKLACRKDGWMDRLLPQMFDNTAVWHYLDRAIDVETDFEDLPKEKRYIIRKVPLY